MSEWISVEDRLPDGDELFDEDDLFVAAHIYEFCGTPDAAVCHFYQGDFYLYTNGLEASNYDGGAVIDMNFTPTHWIPLPQRIKS